NLTINAVTTTGKSDGIEAVNYGSGALSITTTGNTTGTDYDGIYANNSSESTGDLTIITAETSGGIATEVFGGDNGIYAWDKGIGDLNITTSGTTTGENGDGIYAWKETSGALSITTNGTTTGGLRGIYAYNKTGTSSLTIITAETSGGIAAEVLGGGYGIQAKNYGSGALSITTTGKTTGTDYDGIYAHNSSESTGDLTIITAETSGGIAAEVLGGDNGIQANNYGSGALKITTTGTTIGENGDGIYAYNSSESTGDLTIITAETSGEYYGIDANNDGSGALSITTTGMTTGTKGDGIHANNSSNSTGDLTIVAAKTSGGDDGIQAINYGSGTLSITTSSMITGGVDYGISTHTSINETAYVTLNSGAAVSSTAGLGIYNNEGNSVITVNTDASIAGKIVLNEGADSLEFAGGDFSAVTLFDGGSDSLGLIDPIELSKISISVAENSDTLKFSNSSGSLNGDKVTNWEAVEINDGSTISFSNNSLTADMLSINTGGTLNMLSGAFALTGSLGNLGTFNMSDDNTNDSVTVSGDFSGGGQLTMDVDTTTDTSDTLVITGNSSGTTEIIFTNLTPDIATGNTIKDVVTVAGTSSATNFSGSVATDIFNYALEYDNAGSFDFVGSTTGKGTMYRVAPAILGGFNQMTSLHQRRGQRQLESCGEKSASISKEVCTEQLRPNVWLGANWDSTEQKTLSGTDLKYTNQDITVGVDLAFADDANGRWVVNGFAKYGTQSATIDDLQTGSFETIGTGYGVSATLYGNNGTYVDLQGQIMQFKTDISSSEDGLLVKDASSNANSMSVEIGHRIAISETSGLIPQVQLSRGGVNGARFTDEVGMAIDLGTSITKKWRMGVAYDYVTDQSKLYGVGSFVMDSDSVSNVLAAGSNLSETIGDTWGEIGIGGTFTMSNDVSLFGEVSYSQAINNSDAKAYSANVGIKLNW
ncbi:autotransporter outer membrane beta-barrel domain-containing protein, partial [Amylibacter sp.]|nr:autotransporter outer membrane beta-barrel domain-containing protein [Amylibacter sp.]